MRDKKAAAKAPAGTILDGVEIEPSLLPASTPAFERNPPKGQTKKKKETTKPPKKQGAIPTNSETNTQRPAGLLYPHPQHHSMPGYHVSQQTLPQPAGSLYPHHSMPGYNYSHQPFSSHSATHNYNQPFSVWQSAPQQPGLQNHIPGSHYVHSSSHYFTYPPNSGPPPS